MTQDNRLFRWCVAITILGALAFLAPTWPARAEWPRDAFTCKAYRADLYWQEWAREHCRGYRWRHRHRARHVRRGNHHDNAACHGVIEATGEQAQNEANAHEQALVAWKGRVRFRYGERYTEFKNARDAKESCAPSSVADSGRDKALVQLYRCELSARPCRVPAKAVNEDND